MGFRAMLPAAKWFVLIFLAASTQAQHRLLTVTGFVDSKEVGFTLPHEHLLVDFVGAKEYGRSRWNEDEAFSKILPHLLDAKQRGLKTLVDCTPNYLGRDARLLFRLAGASGVQLVTNTALYGGSDNKFLPPYAFSETAEQLAARWVAEFETGIDGTAVRPGFMKISVNPGPLSEISKKLITAAAYTHLATGLTIASHTGPAQPALQQLDILNALGVKPEAFIWVHAQNERQIQKFVDLARMGAWVSLDGVAEENVSWYVEVLMMLKKERLLSRVLVSHDAGWFDPAQPGGGIFRSFTTVFDKLVPALRGAGFTRKDVQQIFERNPARAYSIKLRGAATKAPQKEK